jgi:hypothetical protein
VQQLQQDLQNGFQAKLLPIIQQVVNERKITILFSSADAGIVFADPGWTSRLTSSSGSTPPPRPRLPPRPRQRRRLRRSPRPHSRPRRPHRPSQSRSSGP